MSLHLCCFVGAYNCWEQLCGAKVPASSELPYPFRLWPSHLSRNVGIRLVRMSLLFLVFAVDVVDDRYNLLSQQQQQQQQQ